MGKKSRSSFSSIKAALRERDLEPALHWLAHVRSETELRNLREQKVLFAAVNQDDRATLAAALKDAVQARFAAAEVRQIYLNYADFIPLLTGLLDEVSEETRTLMQQARLYRLPDLLRQLDALALDAYEAKHSADFSRLSSVLRPMQSKDRALDTSEHMLQESVGTTNDLSFAIARTIVHLLEHHRQGFICSDDPAAARELLGALVFQASRWNALEYIGDMVSYGEWSIPKVTNGRSSSVVFDIADPRLARARVLSLRRNVVNRRLRSSAQGPIARVLREPLREVFRIAVTFFAGLDELALLPTSAAAKIESAIDELLADVTVDDEILLVAANDDLRVSAAYLAELTLRCILLSEGIGSGLSHIGARNRNGCEMPVELIRSIQIENEELNRHYQLALSAILSAPRPSRWVALMHRPFVTVQRQMLGFSSLMFTTWTSGLRSDWGKGGVTGRSYGAMWEDLVRDQFERYGWECVGKGVKPRDENGDILTDADLIMFKDGLCLVVQVKGIMSSGFNTYENWKARNTIEKGAKQAVDAVKALQENTLLRSSVMGESARHVHMICGLVVTNSIVFSGWRCGDVPVLSVNSLSSILQGAEVTVTTIDGRSTDIEVAVPRREIGAAEFLEFLESPVEWGIASDTETVDHNWRSEFRVRFALPSLRRA